MGTEALTHSGGGFTCLGLRKVGARIGEGRGPGESGSGLSRPGGGWGVHRRREEEAGLAQGDRWMQMWTLTLSREAPSGGCGRLEPGLRSTRRAAGTPPTALSLELCCAPAQGRPCRAGQEPGTHGRGLPPRSRKDPSQDGGGRGVTWHNALTLDRRWHQLRPSMTSMVSCTAGSKLADAMYSWLSSCHVFLLGTAEGTLGAHAQPLLHAHPPGCPPTPRTPRQLGNRRPARFCCCSCLFSSSLFSE